MKTYKRLLLILAVTCLAFMMLFITFGEAQNGRSSSARKSSARKSTATKKEKVPSRSRLEYAKKLLGQEKDGSAQDFGPYSSGAVAFIETPAVRDLKSVPLSKAEIRKLQARADREKNERNIRRVKPDTDPSKTGPFTDPTLKIGEISKAGRSILPELVTAPLANFDGPDADTGAPLFGGTRFIPPDTNAAVGPNHVVAITNMGLRMYDKAGVPLTAQVRLSTLLVGIANAADDDGDPIVLYDSLADRWLLSQFNLRIDANNSMHQHIAISKTGDPTGAYFAYDFALTPGRVGDYPHFGVWPDGYYMSTNDFDTSFSFFLGAGFYSFERAKMLAGDPTAKVIGFNTPGPTDGGMLPINHQGYTPPPANTPNLFLEWFADEFGPPGDVLRVFEFRPNYTTPASSTLTQLTDIPMTPFDGRSPSPGIQEPAPGEVLDAIADRFMHAANFRVLPGGVQSVVANFTVNVSGVNPVSPATYQAGVRWMELRRNAGTGAITFNQQATYAPGSGSGVGRDLWMASVAQDGEGNLALAASATAPGPTPAALNPTAIYTGRLAADPANTLPQGEVDALSAVPKGVQLATSFNRWGDYSSMFIDPADDCTFWGAFEYVDTPNAAFDWDTRVFSFKVNPACVTPAKGTVQVNVTECSSGVPIPNALVTIDGNAYGATGSGGSFSANLPPGTYSIEVSRSSCSSTTASAVLVTNGATTVVNVCLNCTPVLAAAGVTLVNESCAPFNSAADPGERVSVNLAVTNNGFGSTTNLVGTLQATANVLAPDGPKNYGTIPPGNTVSRTFSFTANGTCGQIITLTLQLQDGANNLGTVTYTMRLGALGAPVTATYSSGNIAVAIPDNTTVEVPITVPDSGSVTDVNVKVRLNHTWDSDLVISLVHPDGTVVPLAAGRGGSGDNFGTGTNDCAGTPTVFDDSAGPSISTGVAPFSGSFKPETPLSALNGKNSNGIWKLRVQDTATGDTGTIGCVQIEITRQPFVCNSSCTQARLVVTQSLSRVGTDVIATLTVQNQGITTATGVTLTLYTLGGNPGTPGPPLVLGNIAAGASASSPPINFGNPGPAGSTRLLKVNGKYDVSSTFSKSQNVVLP